MPTPIVADVVAVRLFESVALALFLFGCWYVYQARSWVVIGGYLGATLTVLFDWTFNTRWFFNVLYSPNFIPLFSIGGVVQPVALSFTYAFFFGIPTAFLALHRDWIDRRFGRWGWVLVFVGMGLLQPLFEIPMVSWLHLWTYYQAPDYLLGGVIWSNIWFSGGLGTACYGALRLALRWESARRPDGRRDPDTEETEWEGGYGPDVRERRKATIPLVIGEREHRVRAALTGVAAIWSAFYATTLLQLLVWYAMVAPWVPSPRSF